MEGFIIGLWRGDGYHGPVVLLAVGGEGSELFMCVSEICVVAGVSQLIR